MDVTLDSAFRIQVTTTLQLSPAPRKAALVWLPLQRASSAYLRPWCVTRKNSPTSRVSELHKHPIALTSFCKQILTQRSIHWNKMQCLTSFKIISPWRWTSSDVAWSLAGKATISQGRLDLASNLCPALTSPEHSLWLPAILRRWWNTLGNHRRSPIISLYNVYFYEINFIKH